jgi:hypothetical protein
LSSASAVVIDNCSNRLITPRRRFQTTLSHYERIHRDASSLTAAKTSNTKLTRTSFTAVVMTPHPASHDLSSSRLLSSEDFDFFQSEKVEGLGIGKELSASQSSPSSG